MLKISAVNPPDHWDYSSGCLASQLPVGGHERGYVLQLARAETAPQQDVVLREGLRGADSRPFSRQNGAAAHAGRHGEAGPDILEDQQEVNVYTDNQVSH